MGRDIHVRILVKNNDTNKWENVKIYYKNNKITYYPYRNYELFDFLCDEVPRKPINTADLPLDLKDEIEKCENSMGYYDFYETNCAELQNYLMKHPKIRDYDKEMEHPKRKDKIYKDNPVKDFLRRILFIIDIVDLSYLYRDFLSDIRVIYWFDS